MRSSGVGVWRKVALVSSAVAVGAALLVAATDPAEAARRRKKRLVHYAPPAASMVVDAKTGRILHASNADAPRIPASITKVMTLYLLFEQLERGRYTLSSPLRVSANASHQAPSKLGLKPGETISVEDAIRALVTKSANDAAVVVAENIAGSEEAFAEAMTRKARAIGMGRTVFHNPHGLPSNPPNLTTARDLITLGRAIQDRFPKYYPYFATRSFEYDGAYYRNHNRLLGRLEGIDGIKTGYTRASGFNLLTSARAGGRHVVAVVLGGRSGRSRDALMASLVAANIQIASAGPRIAPTVGETLVASAPEPVRMASIDPPAPPEPIRAEPPRAPARMAPAAVVAETLDHGLPTTTASIAPRPPRAIDAGSVRPAIASAATATPGAMARTATPAKAPRDADPAVQPQLLPRNVAAFAPVRPGSQEAPRPPGEIRTAATAPQAARHAAAAVHPGPAASVPAARSSLAQGWVIQLGAVDDQAKAQDMLARAKVKSRATLAKAEPFTEKIVKDGTTLWRARFAGFEAGDDAQAACRALKRDGFNCFASRG